MTGLFRRRREPQDLTPAFREAMQSDLRQIRKVYKASFKKTVLPHYRLFFALSMKNPGYQFNVASLNNKVVGFTLIDRATIPNTAHLDFIGVDPSVQRRGIGEGLMLRAEKFALDSNLPVVHLEVRAHNTSAINFYQKLGYDPVGTNKCYYSNGDYALEMEKKVATAAKPPNIKR